MYYPSAIPQLSLILILTLSAYKDLVLAVPKDPRLTLSESDDEAQSFQIPERPQPAEELAEEPEEPEPSSLLQNKLQGIFSKLP